MIFVLFRSSLVQPITPSATRPSKIINTVTIIPTQIHPIFLFLSCILRVLAIDDKCDSIFSNLNSNLACEHH